MSMDILSINGTPLSGIYVDSSMSFNKPQKNVEFIRIPGRSGDLVIDYKTWQNVIISYPCFTKSYSAFEAVINTLGRMSGYQKIECTNDAECYRMGVPSIPQAPTAKKINTNFYFDLTFNCKPQRFLSNIPDITVPVSGSVDIANPTGFEAQPIVRVADAGSIIFKENKTELFMPFEEITATFSSWDTDTYPFVYMNSEQMECTMADLNGIEVAANSLLSLSPKKYPVLYGNNDANSTHVTNNTGAAIVITPRWWKL